MSEPAPVPFPVPAHVVGLGASAGGVEALTGFVSRLPADFEGAVLIVLHIAASGTTVLPQILDRNCRLHVLSAEDGLPLLRGHVYVAPPDRHMALEDGHVRVLLGPRENGHRPAIDPLFRSLARGYGRRAAAVVLSGTRDDGTAGLARVKAMGGRALVQHPDEAVYPSMPQSAIQQVAVDAVLPVEELVRDVLRFVKQEEEHEEVPMAGGGSDAEPAIEDAPATRFTCPECGGVLKRSDENGVHQFVCSVKHVYSSESLDAAQETMVEGALWAGARMLDDRASFLNEMAERSERLGHHQSARQFRERAAEASVRAQALVGLLERTA